MLGTNDLKIEFDRSPQDIADAISGLVSTIREHAVDKHGNPPKILFVSPCFIDNQEPNFAEFYEGVYYDADSARKSHELVSVIKTAAYKDNCYFFEASKVASPGEDCIHFSEGTHANLSDALNEEVKTLLR